MEPGQEGAESVDRKAWSVVRRGPRSVAKASEIVAATEVVCHAPNEMSLFKLLGGCQRLSETKNQSQRRRDGPVKLQSSPS
jgi:hypothetical protein